MKKKISLFVALGFIIAAMFVQQAFAATVTAEISNVDAKMAVGTDVVLSDVAWTSTDASGTMTNGTFTLSSSNTEVLACAENNTCKAVKAGTATLTAKANDGSVTATKEITVEEASTEPTITRVGDKSINIGPSGKQLSVTAASEDIVVTWRSSNTKVAKVSSKGYVDAVTFGTVTITATAEDGSTAKWSVTVNKLKLSMKESSTKDVKSYIKNIKNYKKGKWSKGDSAISVSNNKIKTSAFKKGSNPTKTRTLTYKVGKKSYKLTVTINCKHSYMKNTAFIEKCKRNAKKYHSDYEYYNSAADRMYGASALSCMDEAIKALQKENKCYQDIKNKYYKCEKCGKTKAR